MSPSSGVITADHGLKFRTRSGEPFPLPASLRGGESPGPHFSGKFSRTCSSRSCFGVAGDGAPPHGGMAAGVDRVVMLLAGEQNLREVALFPMNQRAEDLLMGAPSPATPKQLRELHVRLNLPEK